MPTEAPPVPLLTEGWVFLSNAPKEHYVRGARSLCGRWMYLGSTFYGSTAAGCKACEQKLSKETYGPRD